MRAARFEICRGDDGWWARFRAANGRVVWVTETYTQRRTAVAAVESVALALLAEDANMYMQPLHIRMLEVDEREASA